MNDKFRTTEDLAAIEELMAGTSGECQENLLDRYYEYRGLGMSVEMSLMRSELSHIYFDHGGEDAITSTVPLTMEFVHERIAIAGKKEAKDEMIQLRGIPTDKKVELCTEWFDTFVDWGFSLAFSLDCAVKKSRDILDKEYPITDEIAYAYIADFPEPIVRDAMIDAYKKTREQFPEADADDLLHAVVEFGVTAYGLQAVFGKIKGYGFGGDE